MPNTLVVTDCNWGGIDKGKAGLLTSALHSSTYLLSDLGFKSKHSFESVLRGGQGITGYHDARRNPTSTEPISVLCGRSLEEIKAAEDQKEQPDK
jgi:hypothetical protein